MGQAFSGPNAFSWLHLTPEATAVLQADPFLFAELIIVLISCIFIILLAWYIHFVTNKVRGIVRCGVGVTTCRDCLADTRRQVYKKPKSGKGKHEKKKLHVPHIAPWVTKVGT